MHAGGSKARSQSAGSGSSAAGVAGVEAAAQDLYRVALLSVYYIEIWLISGVPYVGELAMVYMAHRAGRIALYTCIP